LFKSINLKDLSFYRSNKNNSVKNGLIYLNNNINYKGNFRNKSKSPISIQNIYKVNAKIDYNKRMVEKEKNFLKDKRNCKSNTKIQYKLSLLKADLNFFELQLLSLFFLFNKAKY